MAASHKGRGLSSKARPNRDSEEEERNAVTVFELFHGRIREKIVLQRLVVIAGLPRHLADRTELGAHYEKLNFQLSKKHVWDHMTGLLLIYPTCSLCVVESSREVLISVLKDMQQQPGSTLLEAPKVLFLAHDPQSRLFQQWSHKVLGTNPGMWNAGAKGLEEEEEESTETLICAVLSALQKLGEHLEAHHMALPGSVLDETPELIVSQDTLVKLLARGDLLTSQQHLQMYDSPLNVRMDFGQVVGSSNLNTV